jgi:peptidoglycan/LPS O-acetylase OafA/YrhL
MLVEREKTFLTNTLVVDQNTTTPQPKKESLHLNFLDGIRGLAAFYVLLFHIIANGDSKLLSDSLLLNFLRFGHEAVVVFIVLSGFVLTLPVVRSSQLTLTGGLVGFFKRRGRRILPGYYAALFMLPVYILIIV